MKRQKRYRRASRDRRRRSGAAKNILAIGLIGDGVVALIWPRRQLTLWKFGPEPYQRLTQAVAERPLLVRLVAAAEIATGLWWNRRVYDTHAA